MAKSTPLFVGLDVHKDSIAVAHAPAAAPSRRCSSAPSARGRRHRSVDSPPAGQGRELRFAYEAGPSGYGLYRYLTGKGLACQVVAPSLIPRSPGTR